MYDAVVATGGKIFAIRGPGNRADLRVIAVVRGFHFRSQAVDDHIISLSSGEALSIWCPANRVKAESRFTPDSRYISVLEVVGGPDIGISGACYGQIGPIGCPGQQLPDIWAEARLRIAWVDCGSFSCRTVPDVYLVLFTDRGDAGVAGRPGHMLDHAQVLPIGAEILPALRVPDAYNRVGG